MDVYLPANRSITATKVIVLIHGGGWNGGSKAEFDPYIYSLKKRVPDYAIFNINYRLVNSGNLFPTQEYDVKSAIDFISKKASQYGINKDKIVLLGFSSGAHLALLQGYKYNNPKIKAVIDFFGPTDMVDMYNNPMNPLVSIALQTIVGGTSTSNSAMYTQSSPINYVTGRAPPFIILHGAWMI
ncbi:MAG: hypothetical protein C4308_12650 [Chitinophagaceae bacterium]